MQYAGGLKEIWFKYLFMCLCVHQARGGTHGRGGTTVTEGNTRVSHCYHWPLRRTPLWAAKSLDWPLHLVPPNPTHHVSHLDWRPLGQKRGRGGGLSLRVGSQSGDRGLNWKKKLNITALLGGARSETLIFFLSVFAPQRWPTAANQVTKAAGGRVWVGEGGRDQVSP